MNSLYDVINIEIIGLILWNESLCGCQLNLPKYFDLCIKKIMSKWTFLQTDSLSHGCKLKGVDYSGASHLSMLFFFNIYAYCGCTLGGFHKKDLT